MSSAWPRWTISVSRVRTSFPRCRSSWRIIGSSRLSIWRSRGNVWRSRRSSRRRLGSWFSTRCRFSHQVVRVFMPKLSRVRRLFRRAVRKGRRDQISRRRVVKVSRKKMWKVIRRRISSWVFRSGYSSCSVNTCSYQICRFWKRLGLRPLRSVKCPEARWWMWSHHHLNLRKISDRYKNHHSACSIRILIHTLSTVRVSFNPSAEPGPTHPKNPRLALGTWSTNLVCSYQYNQSSTAMTWWELTPPHPRWTKILSTHPRWTHWISTNISMEEVVPPRGQNHQKTEVPAASSRAKDLWALIPFKLWSRQKIKVAAKDDSRCHSKFPMSRLQNPSSVPANMAKLRTPRVVRTHQLRKFISSSIVNILVNHISSARPSRCILNHNKANFRK